MNKSWLFSILLALYFLSFSQNTSASWIDGTWTGTGFQLNGHSTWTIKFICKSSKDLYTIIYPSLNCSGEWTLLSLDNNIAKFKETITDNTVNCVTGGTVIITKIDDNYITYTWFWPNGDLGAWSTLTKQ